jgi:hypothetical protein
MVTKCKTGAVHPKSPVDFKFSKVSWLDLWPIDHAAAKNIEIGSAQLVIW